MFFNLDWAVATGPDVEAAAVVDAPVGAVAVAPGKLKGAEAAAGAAVEVAGGAELAVEAAGCVKMDGPDCAAELAPPVGANSGFGASDFAVPDVEGGCEAEGGKEKAGF